MGARVQGLQRYQGQQGRARKGTEDGKGPSRGPSVCINASVLICCRSPKKISQHLKRIFAEGELDEKVVVAKNAIPTRHGALEGKTQSKLTQFYNLDAIISVSYRLTAKGDACPQSSPLDE